MTLKSDRISPKRTVLDWIDAFNEADVERITSLYTSEAVNHQVVGKPVKGRKRIRAMFREAFSLTKMVCIPENIFCDGEWAILEWRDPKGLRGCGFFHVRRGKIFFQRGYWDKLSFHKLHRIPLPHDKGNH